MKKILLTIFVFLFGSLGLQVCQADGNLNFPKILVYKLFLDGTYGGEATLSFIKTGTRRTGHKTHTIKLSNFKGLGFQKDEILMTDIDKKDLSIYSTILVKKGLKRPLFEARVNDSKDSLMGAGKGYKYRDQNKTSTIDTGLYSNLISIDLLSSFIITSEMVRKNKTEEDFYFLIKEKSKIITIKAMPPEVVKINNKSIPTIPMALFYSPKGGSAEKMFIFYVDKKKFYPVKVIIPNGSSTVELING